MNYWILIGHGVALMGLLINSQRLNIGCVPWQLHRSTMWGLDCSHTCIIMYVCACSLRPVKAGLLFKAMHRCHDVYNYIYTDKVLKVQLPNISNKIN